MPSSLVPEQLDTLSETKKKEWVTPLISDQTIQSLTESKFAAGVEFDASNGPPS